MGENRKLSWVLDMAFMMSTWNILVFLDAGDRLIPSMLFYGMGFAGGVYATVRFAGWVEKS